MSQALTETLAWPAAAFVVYPSTVTLHGPVKFVTLNCSSTGATGTMGAGTRVTVSRPCALIEWQITRIPGTAAPG